MAKVSIEDVIVPEIFLPYVTKRTTEKSALIQSGIMAVVPDVDLGANLKNGGWTIHIPFWEDSSGRSQVLSDTNPLTTNKIGSGSDIAVAHYRGNAWMDNELAGTLSGDDPSKAIGEMVSDYWTKDMQTSLVYTLEGVFSSADMSGNTHDISSQDGDLGSFNSDTFIDAAFKLGDAHDKLKALAVHSMTMAKMIKNDDVDFVPDSEGNLTIPTYKGKYLVVDDGMPVEVGGIYTSYLFGQGAVGFAEGTPKTPIETDRDSLAGDDVLINRKAFVMHIRGVKWTGAQSTTTPTDSQMQDGANWERVYDPKQIRVVRFKHKL